MATAIKYPTSTNAVQKTLGAQLLAGATTSMTLNNVVGIQNKAGVCVVDRVDANGNATASKREYITFTGVSGSTLTGLTRNSDGGGTDQDHAVGAIVEFVSDVLQQQAIIDGLLLTVTTAGALNKAAGSDVTTGTDDAKIVTSKALADAGLTVTATSTTTLTNKTLTTPVIASFYQDAGKTKLMTTPNTASDTLAAIAATQTFTNKTLTSPLFQGTIDGWISANETWTYASTTTITVPSGATSKYAVGDRLKFTQHSTVKYAVLIKVEDTLLTIPSNDDYLFEDTATYPITLNYYSHQASPVGYPQWFNYTPTWTAVAPLTFTSSDSRIRRFSITGKTCTVEFAEGGTTGGSAGPSITMTLPIALTVSNPDYFATGVCCYEGTYETGTLINSNATVVRFQKYAGGNWGIGASRYIIGNFTYKIA